MIGDELCSGTETNSAISIVSAGIISLIEKRTSFIFATHLHELSKYEKRSPLRMRIKLRQEQTLVQNRTIVYDSVGVGLGQYRYDPIFNTYIHDLNGSFIS